MMIDRQKELNIRSRAALILPILLISLFFSSCDLFKKENTTTDSGITFRNVYDITDTIHFSAVDIQQTPDGGYIILGMIDDTYPYLLRVDDWGNFLWDTKTDPQWQNYRYPVANLLVINRAYYFFCNAGSGDTWLPTLVKIDEDKRDTIITVTQLEPCDPYEFEKSGTFVPIEVIPKHAAIRGENDYLLMTVSRFGDGLTFAGGGNGAAGWDMHNVAHRNGPMCLVRFPTIDERFHHAGALKNSGKFYVQTFSAEASIDQTRDWCLSIKTAPLTPGDSPLEFTIDNEKPLIAVALDDSQWHEGKLKVSGVSIDNFHIDTFVDYEITIDAQKETQRYPIDVSDPFTNIEVDELKPVFLATMIIDDRKILFAAGTTKGARAVLNVHGRDENKTVRYSKRYFGEIHVHDSAGLIATADGGLGLLGTAFIDEYKRIFLFKLSQAEVKALVK